MCGRLACGIGALFHPCGFPFRSPVGKVCEMSDYEIVHGNDVEDAYAGTSVPGEFRRLTEALGCEQLAVTLIRVPPHSDFEQGTGHHHHELEELYVVARGAPTLRLGNEIKRVAAGSVVRVAPQTPRSHRNEGDEPVEIWALSRKLDGDDGVKLDDFWGASPDAAQERDPAG
jgi:mannose-6-phosphate isomerase-like protein (cupin superfamily)